MQHHASSGPERIEQAFQRAASEGRPALMPFLTAGDPDLSTTASLFSALPAAGADIIELGIPFSDPIADGPVIAESMHRALLAGVTPESVLACVAAARPSVPVLAMVSVSIVERVGASRFIADARAAGLDGLIVPDAGPDFWTDALLDRAHAVGLAVVELIAPSTPIDRVRRIALRARSFVYLLARAGITGEQRDAPEIAARVDGIRAIAPVRIAVGFGISNAQHVRAVGAHADGAIVGSALVRRLDEARVKGDDSVAVATEFVRALRGSTTIASQ
jgi:tryptophan synthase alpha chain